MSRQLDAPINHLSLSPTNRMADGIYHQIKNGRVLLDPPYQRDSVWTNDQRLDLMYSFLSGYPVGTLVFNDRMSSAWGRFKVAYSVIDGRQRLETVVAWFEGALAIPASWLESKFYATYAVTDDGPYVTINDLTDNGDRMVESRMSLPVVTAQVATLAAEAEIYRLVNTGGTAHTDEQIARATVIEEGGAAR